MNQTHPTQTPRLSMQVVRSLATIGKLSVSHYNALKCTVPGTECIEISFKSDYQD